MSDNEPYSRKSTRQSCWNELPVELKSVTEWQLSAACTRYADDPDAVWCSDQGKNSIKARRICWEECPVRRECLTYAISQRDRFCIWGGYSEDERRIINRNWRKWKCWPNIERHFPDPDEFATFVFESLGKGMTPPADWGDEPTETELNAIEAEGFDY